MRLSPEYHKLSKIEWSDVFTLRIRGHVGLNNPFSLRERDEISSCLCSVIRSLTRERANDAVWLYSNDFSSADLLVNKSYSQVQILYKITKGSRIDEDEFLFKLNDFLKELYENKNIKDSSVDLSWQKNPNLNQIKYFFKIKEDTEYKHFIYSNKFIKNVNKLQYVA
jgi:hypothetical protein